MTARLLCGDVREVLKTLPDASARCCVTSPPYFGLRNYGMDGQIGAEKTPQDFVGALVEVFEGVKRVLTEDGTLWLNLGDSYSTHPPTSTKPEHQQRIGGATAAHSRATAMGRSLKEKRGGLPEKNMMGMPWRVAFALQDAGWILRRDIIWAKPNPMPEAVKDRPTTAHEYIFLLSKSPKYFYDAEAVADPSITYGEDARSDQGNIRYEGKRTQEGADGQQSFVTIGPTRNARSVWTIPVRPYAGAHFATFPEELPRRCIKAGSAPGDTILDPFGGSGTTAAVAVGLGREAIHIDLNPKYIELAKMRIGPMLCV